MAKRSSKMTPAEQSEAFIKIARELGTDERPEAFDRLVKRIGPKRAETPKAAKKR